MKPKVSPSNFVKAIMRKESNLAKQIFNSLLKQKIAEKREQKRIEIGKKLGV